MWFMKFESKKYIEFQMALQSAFCRNKVDMWRDLQDVWERDTIYC